MNFIKRRNLPELLAPAGSLEHLKAAVAAGADAVYMGGEKFGARAYAQNFSRKDMIEALQFAHFHERKLYLTVNTLMKEKELFEELGDFLFPYYENGLDGVIVQDLGAVRYIREHFPGMEIHGSTQMTVTDVSGAIAAKRMGMTRVVPARELSLEEIKKIKKETGLEVEVFVHGALCYCYSGQCLLSSIYGERSGNRGRCAQPCRLQYHLKDNKGKLLQMPEKGNYLLSPKDLCSLSMLPSLIDLPVDSLKIEGRMKNVEYVAGVTSIYRKYLDIFATGQQEGADFKPEASDLHALEELYCRGSFTDGYWKRHNGQKMMSTISPKNTGRKIGQVRSVSKNKVQISYEDKLHPRDILVIPVSANRQEELVLTVPSRCQENPKAKGQITLNIPRTQGLKPGMAVYRRKNMELSSHIEKDILNKVIKYPVTGDITLKIGEPLMLQLFCRDECAFVEGPLVEASQKRPVTKEDILRQMQKTGNVPFALESFEVNMEENCFLPMSVLKGIRQQGFALLEERLKNSKKREVSEYNGKNNLAGTKKAEEGKLLEDSNSKNVVSVKNEEARQAFEEDSAPKEKKENQEKIATVYNKEQFTNCCEDSFFDGICLPSDFFSYEELLSFGKTAQEAGKKVYLSLPRVFRQEADRDSNLEKICESSIWNGIYAYTINEAEFLHELKERKAKVIAAASLYHWNSNTVAETKALYPEIGVRECPIELSGKEMQQMIKNIVKEKSERPDENRETFELLVHGRVPLMQSAQCLKKTTGHCNKTSELLGLYDKKGRKLPVTTHCKWCYNLIWQDRPYDLIGEDLTELAFYVTRYRFDLLELTKQEVEEMKERYFLWEKSNFAKDFAKETEEHHWNYGIE